VNFRHALNCYKLIRKNSELSRVDTARLLKRYLVDKESVCELPGLDRPYYFEKDSSSLFFAHSAIRRIQEIVKNLPELPDRALLIDVGANNGWFTSSIAQRQSGIQAHLFEPNKNLSAAICKNMNVAGISYTISNDALSREKGTASLYVPAINSQHGSLIFESATYAARSDTIINTLSVNTNTLDSYLEDHDIEKVDFLKVDIQGAELSLLLGAEKALKCTQMALFEISFLDGKLDETLTILHKEFPKHKVMAPVQFGADVLFYR
jgi:FkbM family methyltransferase